ncbi:MAG: hypothetical protein IK134_08600 [Oscillospiraceae bacterium]|nr:hypothetical protein [Oscillospiraceae bacterium]
MIKVHFYDYGCGKLDIEKELGITDEVYVFLMKKIPELELEATDNVCDLDDNLILWFSANEEEKCMKKIHDIIKAHISGQSKMQYTVKITADFSWYD